MTSYSVFEISDEISEFSENNTDQRNDSSWPRFRSNPAHSKAIGRALEVLEFLMQKDPTNIELLKVYKELCVEDAKLQQQDETLKHEEARTDANERIELAKLQVSAHGNQTKSLIEANKLCSPVDEGRYLTKFVELPDLLSTEHRRSNRFRNTRRRDR